MLLSIIKKYISFMIRMQLLYTHSTTNFLQRFESIPTYYRINDLLWQDGLLIDFVQKKIVDKWIRKFLILSSYLFSERVLFTFVVKFYNDIIVWPSTHTSLFEFSNVSLTLHSLLAALLSLVLVLNFTTLFLLFF